MPNQNPPEQSPAPVALPQIASIGVSIWDPVWAVTDHTSWCCELVHIVKGSMRFHIDGATHAARAGDTLFVPAGAVHRDEFASAARPEVLHIQFTWQQPRLLLSSRDNALLTGLSARAKRRIARKAREIHESFCGSGTLAAHLTQALLLALLLHLKAQLSLQSAPRPAASRAGARHEELMAMAREYVESHLGEPVGLAGIAQHLGLSTYHLSHVFSQLSGFTLSSFITQRRMEKARELLADPRRRVSEVAFLVGYTDPNHFAKTFRRHFGRSPSQAR